MTPKTILSLDPGGSTGWALFIDSPQGARIKYGVIDMQEHHYTLWKLLHETSPDCVLCEEFIYQRRKVEKGVTLEIVSREYIGVAKLYAEIESVPFRLTRLNELAFWTDEKLRQVRCWSDSIHSRDATRHLLWWLSFRFGDQRWIACLK